MSILLLHKPNASRRRHLEATRRYADARGQRLVLLMAAPGWERDLADRVLEADATDLDAVRAAVARLRAEEDDPVTAVVSYAEACVPSVARVAADLGLPGTGPDSARAARDKYAMRAAFARAGDIPQPRYALARTLDEARRAADGIGYPMVLKPVLGTGSMFVRTVADDAELAEHFTFHRSGAWTGFEHDPLHGAAHEEYQGALLLEEYLPDTEICVEGFVHEGRTHIVAVHDKPLPTGPTFEEVYACTPTRLPAATMASVEKATAAVHRALGIESGPTHVEFRLRGEVEPVVLEAAARMGGGPIYRSVQLSTGIDMVTAALDAASGRRPDLAPKWEPRPVGFWNIFPERPGRLAEIEGEERARALDHVDELVVYRSVGDHLKTPPETFQGHGHLIFTADRVDRLDDTFHELTRTLRLRTEPPPEGGPLCRA